MILGFKDRFVPMVKNGTKRHSCRSGERWKVGARADCYSRPRQKGMALIFRAKVTKVDTLKIELNRGVLKVFQTMDGAKHKGTFGVLVDKLAIAYEIVIVTINGTRLSRDEMEAFFYVDGFREPNKDKGAEVAKFLYKKITARPFVGQVVHWDFRNRFMIADVKKRKR